MSLHKCLNYKGPKELNTWSYASHEGADKVETSSEISSNSYGTLKSACLAGLGIARLFHYDVASDLKENRLIELFPEVDWGVQTIHAVYHGKMSDSAKIKALIEYVTDNDPTVYSDAPDH